MKIIENKVTGIKESHIRHLGNPEVVVDFKALLEMALDIIPQGGFTPKDLRERNRIQNVLEKSKSDIKLEDTDYNNLKQIIINSRWLTRHVDLVEFINKFEKDEFPYNVPMEK